METLTTITSDRTDLQELLWRVVNSTRCDLSDSDIQSAYYQIIHKEENEIVRLEQKYKLKKNIKEMPSLIRELIWMVAGQARTLHDNSRIDDAFNQIIQTHQEEITTIETNHLPSAELNFEAKVEAYYAKYQMELAERWVSPGDLVYDTLLNKFFICGNDPKDVAELRRRKGSYERIDYNELKSMKQRIEQLEADLAEALDKEM